MLDDDEGRMLYDQHICAVVVVVVVVVAMVKTFQRCICIHWVGM